MASRTHKIDLAVGVDGTLADRAPDLNLDLPPALAARTDARSRLSRARKNGREPVDVAPMVERLEEQLEGGRQKSEEDNDGAESGPPSRVEVAGACVCGAGTLACSSRQRTRATDDGPFHLGTPFL